MKNLLPTAKELYLSIFTAISFSIFIYLAHFNIELKIIDTIAALTALYLLLHLDKKIVIYSGFFIGLLWFYWIGFSFRYYDLSWAMGFVSFGFGLIYALFFAILTITKKPLFRAVILFALSYFYPLDFNWMQLELIFIHSYIGIEKWQFIVVLLALALTDFKKNGYLKLAPLLLLLLTIDTTSTSPSELPLKVSLVQTDISQDFKWQRDNLQNIIEENFKAIEEAIDDGSDLVVLPETAFSIYMNHNPHIHQRLIDYSHHISIITGALYSEDGKFYNVSYHYMNGDFTIAKKTVLVPFGEYIPLPAFARDILDKYIFKGGADFTTASEPTIFNIKSYKIKNAICYEATRGELYERDIEYMVAISNNSWFKPSIEPTLQELLIKFYAKKSKTTVYHSANGGGGGVIRSTP